MATRLFTKIGSFEYNAKNGSVHVFKFRSTPADESGFGKLFGMAESAGRDGEEKIKILEDIISEYYNPAMRLQWSRGRNLSTESLFEELLHEVNSEWIGKGYNPEDKDIQAVIGLQKDEKLYIAAHGAARALMFRERRDGDRAVNFQHFDILRIREEEPTPEKNFFNSMIDGDLQTGDAIVLLSGSFLEKLTLREVEKALLLNPQSGAALLQDLIEEQKSENGVGAVIFRRLAEEDAPGRQRIAVTPQTSVDTLRGTEKSTEKMLAPQTLPNVKEFLASITLNGQNKNPRQSFARRNERGFGRSIQKFLKGIFKIIFLLFSGIFSLASFLFAFSTNWHGRRTQLIGKWRMSSKAKAEHTVASFNTLPRKSKTILFAGLMLIFIFTQSAIYLTKKNYNAERERAWRALYEDILAKRDEIESYLVYGDEEKAKTLLTDAETSFIALKNDSKKHEEDTAKIKALLDQTSMRVYRVALLENPAALASIDEKISADSLLMVKGRLIASGRSGAVSLNPGDKSAKDFPAPPLSSDEIIFTEDGESVVAISRESSAVLGPEGWAIVPFTKNKLSDAVDAVAYGGNLYILDSEGDNIWKYGKTAEGYGGEASWLRENQELQSVSSFAIDGSMYLLEAAGIIRKFYRGREQEFHTDAIVPALGGGSKTASTENMPVRKGKIRTASGSDYLYVLDPAGKRVIVWKKDGRLAAQYISPRFDDLRDLAFNEKSKELYVLNGNTVMAVLAIHLDKK